MLPTADLAPPRPATGPSVVASQVQNFVLAGDARSGVGVVQSSISGSPAAVCHADLFHTKPSIRARCHIDYFGPCSDREPDWWVEGITNPCQYLKHRIFDTALNGELAVGVRVLYPRIRQLELYDLLAEELARGSFCVVHVERNPVACLVSREQSRRSKIRICPANCQPNPIIPSPIILDPDVVTAYVRNHLSVRAKIDRSSDADILVVQYRRLVCDFTAVMRDVYEFLDIPAAQPAPADRRRLRNRTMRERIANFAELRAKVPHDVREIIDAPDLF